jgi:microcystin degradation protein MlrC
MTPAHRRRVGIIALLQESNTFLAGRTTLDHFRADLLATGPAVRETLAEAHHEVGGFFAGLAAAGIEPVPIFAARAIPYGTMTAECLEALLEMMAAAIEAAGPLDGLLVAPHGATVSEQIADVDGHWLGLVRRRLGAIPIIGTIDPHANLSPAMVAATDALIAYRTNPHVDQRDRGLEAAGLMARTLAGEIRPTQAAAFPPLVINIECQDPSVFPCLPHYEAAARLRSGYENASAADPVARGTVLSTSIVLGFPYADVPEMGSAAIVVTHDDLAAARRHADAVGDGLWQARDTFRPALAGIEVSLDRAAAVVGPVCLLDMGDNVGGGSPADGMAIARAILRRGIRRRRGRAAAARRGRPRAGVGGRSRVAIDRGGVAGAGRGRWPVHRIPAAARRRDVVRPGPNRGARARRRADGDGDEPSDGALQPRADSSCGPRPRFVSAARGEGRARARGGLRGGLPRLSPREHAGRDDGRPVAARVSPPPPPAPPI